MEQQQHMLDVVSADTLICLVHSEFKLIRHFKASAVAVRVPNATSGGAMTSRQPGHFQVTNVVRQKKAQKS